MSSNTEICVGCLATDVRTYNINVYKLEVPYKLLTGLELNFINYLAHKLCWECAALVNKFNMFRLKCERAHTLLHDCYMMHGENFASNITFTDRLNQNLTTKLSIYPNESWSNFENECKIECDDEKYTGHDFNAQFDDCVQEIKYEHVEFELLPIIKEEIAIKKRKKTHKNKRDSRKRKECERDAKINGKFKKNNIKRKLEKKKHVPYKIDCSAFATHVMLTQEQQVEEVRQRQFSSEYTQSKYKCDLCFKGFNMDKTYKNHMLQHDPVSGPYQCDICKHRYKQRRHVANHITKVHANKYHCKLCSHVSQSPEQASNHDKWHSGVTYKCDICNLKFTKRSTQLSHVRIKHPSQHICRACGASFVSARGLTMHLNYMHKEERESSDGPYCESCGIKFVTKAAYHKHVLISEKHESEKETIPNGCRECGECFDSQSALRSHARQHRQKKGTESRFPARCTQCPETLLTAMQHWQHFRKAHPGLSYPSTKTNVICEYCGKGFPNNTLLRAHSRTHGAPRARRPAPARARSHACPCGKAFRVRQALLRHQRIHTGEKPYSCEVCGRAFADPSAKKLHVKTVHLKEPRHSSIDKDYFVT